MPRIIILLLFTLISSCDYFQYSPHAIDFDESQTNLNAKNLLKLQSNVGDDTIRFAITGDSQEATDELNELVESVNSLSDIDFILIAGDLTQDSYVREYKWVHRELKNLIIPYIAVVGNHDLRRNGERLFLEMFGALDFSFTYENTKFICLNNSSYIYDWNGKVPNLEWLSEEMDNSADVENIVVVSHIPPWYPPKFDPKLEIPYVNTLSRRSKTLVSIHAHAGLFYYGQPYGDGIDYLLVPSVVDDPTTPVDKSYVVATIVGNTLSYEKINY